LLLIYVGGQVRNGWEAGPDLGLIGAAEEKERNRNVFTEQAWRTTHVHNTHLLRGHRGGDGSQHVAGQGPQGLVRVHPYRERVGVNGGLPGAVRGHEQCVYPRVTDRGLPRHLPRLRGGAWEEEHEPSWGLASAQEVLRSTWGQSLRATSNDASA
jgi:hypothetical protein